jgi:hypothetical protein
MKKVKYIETVIYYDVPQLFIVEDEVNLKYLCVLAEHSEETFNSLCVPISNNRLRLIKEAQYDIGLAFKEPEINEYFLLSIKNESDELSLNNLLFENITPHWFPELDFFYPIEETVTEEIVEESIKKFRGIIHLSLNPPESASENKINTQRLSSALAYFQSLIKQAHKKAISTLKEKSKYLDPEYFETEVFSFSPGSFKVHIQSKQTADFFGFSSISLALNKIDELLRNPDDLAGSIEIMKQNKGHLISSLIHLLDFIIKNETPITYNWTTPEIKKPQIKSISKTNAEKLYVELTKVEEMSSEEIILLGKVIKADSKYGTWAILNEEDNRIYNGLLSDKYPVTLSGIIIEEVKYKFICEEILEDVFSSGKEKRKIYLKEYVAISKLTNGSS